MTMNDKPALYFSARQRIAFLVAAVASALLAAASMGMAAQVGAVFFAAATVLCSVLFTVSFVARRGFFSEVRDERESLVSFGVRARFGIGMFVPLAAAGATILVAGFNCFSAIASGQTGNLVASVVPWLVAAFVAVAISQTVTRRYGTVLSSVV